MPRRSPQGPRVLVLDDGAADVAPVTSAVRTVVPGATIEDVASEPEFVRALETFIPDVVVTKHPGALYSTLGALRLVQSHRPATPLLIVGDVFDRTVAEALRAGAEDFVDTADLSRLGPVIAKAMELREPLRGLTRRQCEVLRLLASGCSTRDIAKRMSVSVKTVETHRANLMKRLKLRDLASLVRYALRVGVVPSHQ